MVFVARRLRRSGRDARSGGRSPPPRGSTFMTTSPTESHGASSEQPPADEPGLDIRELVGILQRRKRVILSTVLLVTSLAVLAGLQVTPRYTASALVMIDPRKSNVVDVESVIQGLGTDASTVESQIRVISSRFQLERLAERFDVVNDPEFNLILRQPEREVDYRGEGLVGTALGWLPEIGRAHV